MQAHTENEFFPSMDPITLILLIASTVSFVLHALHLNNRYAVTAEAIADAIVASRATVAEIPRNTVE